jgi:hypothetical protein
LDLVPLFLFGFGGPTTTTTTKSKTCQGDLVIHHFDVLEDLASVLQEQNGPGFLWFVLRSGKYILFVWRFYWVAKIVMADKSSTGV